MPFCQCGDGDDGRGGLCKKCGGTGAIPKLLPSLPDPKVIPKDSGGLLNELTLVQVVVELGDLVEQQNLGGHISDFTWTIYRIAKERQARWK